MRYLQRAAGVVGVVGVVFGAALGVMVATAPANGQGGAQGVNLESLLREMIDRDAVARFPDPAYACRQFSSYDRASVSPDKPDTWFANGDVDQFLRVEETSGRKEWVMMDVDGPGAIVRFWSANPPDGSTIRIYFDGSPTPGITKPFQSMLNGKGDVREPLAAVSANGWNLYLPIPYARHAKVTCDKPGFYYQLNYRTYAAGTKVETYSDAAMEAAKGTLATVQAALAKPHGVAGEVAGAKASAKMAVRAGGSESVALAAGPAAVREITLSVGTGSESADERATMLQNLVLQMEFDGEQTVWCPLSHFVGGGIGHYAIDDWYRTMAGDYSLRCRWVMPYKASAKMTIANLGTKEYGVTAGVTTTPYAKWDERLMHFHSCWRYEYPIHALGARGTKDWNYIEIQGKGVYLGDNLAIMNPSPDWWGEGDEKIYVDGEKFPSHFGTGTEDYYGYAWSSYQTFSHPFHGQPRCDGMALKNNWGHSTVTRVRSLDAIPFTTGLKFDMEVWHWKACDVAYGATTYFYAMPGATTNRKPQPEEAGKPVLVVPPLPPPFKVAGAIEAETMKVVGRSAGITVGPQDGFGPRLWSGGAQLWVQGNKAGDFVEVEVPIAPELRGKPIAVTAYLTRSWDYAVVRFSVEKKALGADIDTFNDKAHEAVNTGPIALGKIDAAQTKGEKFVLRMEVVSGNARSEGNKSFFGVDCLVLKEAK